MSGCGESVSGGRLNGVQRDREGERSRHMDASVVEFEVCIIYIFTFYHNWIFPPVNCVGGYDEAMKGVCVCVRIEWSPSLKGHTWNKDTSLNDSDQVIHINFCFYRCGCTEIFTKIYNMTLTNWDKLDHLLSCALQIIMCMYVRTCV